MQFCVGVGISRSITKVYLRKIVWHSVNKFFSILKDKSLRFLFFYCFVVLDNSDGRDFVDILTSSHATSKKIDHRKDLCYSLIESLSINVTECKFFDVNINRNRFNPILHGIGQICPPLPVFLNNA